MTCSGQSERKRLKITFNGSVLILTSGFFPNKLLHCYPRERFSKQNTFKTPKQNRAETQFWRKKTTKKSPMCPFCWVLVNYLDSRLFNSTFGRWNAVSPWYKFLSLFFSLGTLSHIPLWCDQKCVQFALCSYCPGTMLSLCLVIFVGRCSSSVPVMLVCFGRWRHFILAGFSSLTCMCNVLWTASVLDWQNPFPHSWHLNGFSFEWMYLEGRTDKRSNVIWQHNSFSSRARETQTCFVLKRYP